MPLAGTMGLSPPLFARDRPRRLPLMHDNSGQRANRASSTIGLVSLQLTKRCHVSTHIR
jgi:hypothetical protein